MPPDPESDAFVHDLRVFVSAMQLTADEVLGPREALNGPAFALRDQVELLADILRVTSYLSAEGGDEPDRPVDLRALAFVARSRRASTFLGEMQWPVQARLDPVSALELIELAAYWAAGDEGKLVLHARPKTSSLVLEASGAPLPSSAEDCEVEQAMESLAGSCRVKVVLRRNPRAVVLAFGSHAPIC